MERERLRRMSVEELWQLHTVVNDILALKLLAKKEELERRLGLLNRGENTPLTGHDPEE